MADLDDDFSGHVTRINEGKENFSEDEQNIIDAWVTKLSEPKDTDEEKTIRNEYAWTLARLTTEERQLMDPFSGMPPDGDLTPLSDSSPPEGKEGKETKYNFPPKPLPCAKAKGTGATRKNKQADISRSMPQYGPSVNEFEDPEEMARVIARSKGQSFADFVFAISRHTLDFGQELRAAMKIETTSFRQYVDHVLSQRLKDLTEVLDEEQNTEIQKIKKDIEKWQIELTHCKKRIREVIPDFDLESYKKDKNYIKKLFAVGTGQGLPQDDSFKNWKEQSCHRLKWLSQRICRFTRCNEQTTQELTEMKARALEMEAKETAARQNHIMHVNCVVSQYQKLKMELDQLHKQIADLLTQLQEFGEY